MLPRLDAACSEVTPPPGFGIFSVVAIERLATFDCYGTLVDWLGGMRAALQELAPDDAERLLRACCGLEPRSRASTSAATAT
jgi:hypothetical protein